MNIEKQVYPFTNNYNVRELSVFPQIEDIVYEKTKIKKNKKIPIKTCVASISLNIVGIIFFILFLYFFIEHKNHEGAIPMLILSLLSLIPGIYSGISLFGAIRGWNGYYIDSIPSYDEL